MRFSVIIPTYNRAGTVVEAVESVLDQSSPAAEIIVVDDGSTDDTVDRLERYRDRITLINQPNGGVSVARNTGLARATGDWITFLDSDDLWLPNRLAVTASACRETAAGVHVADLLFTGSDYDERLFDIRDLPIPDGQSRHVERPISLVASGLSLMSIACRRDWVARSGGFDPDLRMYEDLDFLLRLALEGPWLFQSTVVSTARRVEHDTTMALTDAASRQNVRATAGRSAIFASLARRPDLDASDRHTVARYLSGALFAEARARLRQGGRAEALPPLRRSIGAHNAPFTAALKAGALLALGERRYARLTASRRGFYREDHAG